MDIAVLPGDGVGPEVTSEAVQCLQVLSDHRGLGLRFGEHDFGGIAIDRHGEPLPALTLAACREADAILLGAVGGPKWDGASVRPEQGLLRLRKELGLFANLRPAKTLQGLEHISPIRPETTRGADILIVRELTGGIYFGERHCDERQASDLCAYDRDQIERVAHVAFRAARTRRGKLTSVDKANVLATSKLWRQTVTEIAADYPDVTIDHLYVDACAMALILEPRRFDVVLTENLFGDILSDELSALGGSIGLLGSASIGAEGPGLFEPIHGSAPALAGLDTVNPAGTIASTAMMLDQLDFGEWADVLRGALEQTLAEGCRTPDVGGDARCSEFGDQVRRNLCAALRRHDAQRQIISAVHRCCA
nr:3-isopropylmalate dehydrogenase [Sphingomonas jaspsi]